MIDCVDAFLDLLADPKTDFRVKLMYYGEPRMDIFEGWIYSSSAGFMRVGWAVR